jgi:hypothetical protein
VMLDKRQTHIVKRLHVVCKCPMKLVVSRRPGGGWPTNNIAAQQRKARVEKRLMDLQSGHANPRLISTLGPKTISSNLGKDRKMPRS